MELKANLEDIERLVQERANEQMNESSLMKQVSKKEILKQLSESEKEIIKKHKEARTLWKKSVELYTDFLKKNPGSKQLNPPKEMPEEPKQLDEIRGYIKMFNSLVDDEFYLEQHFLREIFNATSEGIYSMKHTAYLLQTAVSGMTVVNNY